MAIAETIESEARDEHPLVATRVRARDGELWVDLLWISAADRGRGLGDHALLTVLRAVDRLHLAVRISPDDAFGSDLRRLIRWYGRHGFGLEPDRTMIRPARTSPAGSGRQGR